MAVIRQALVESGVATNVVLVDDASAWSPPEGCECIDLTDDEAVGPGTLRVDGAWVEPDPEPDVERPPDPIKQAILAATDFADLQTILGA